MERVIVAQVKEQEKQEVESLFERINAIKTLVRTLAEENDLYDENSKLYTRLVSDLAETNKRYENWWKSIVDNYGLERSNINKYIIDFYDNCIYLSV